MSSLEITGIDRKILITTSVLAFLFPSLFLFQQEHYIHSICNLLSGIASICYWYDPTSELFHLIDVITSRFSIAIYFCTTLYYAYITSIEHTISTLLLIIQIAYFYLKSRHTYFHNEAIWIVYHAGFHVSCFISTTFCYFLLQFQKN